MLRARLEDARVPAPVTSCDALELSSLPAPVQRYFKAVLADRQRMVEAADLEQTGSFMLSETTGQWKPLTASQHIVTHRPGFDWNARIAIMPGIWVRVHDGYFAGEGVLHAALFGLLSKVNLRDRGELARGELMRFFAEAPWYPTALLPSQGIVWVPVDDHSARATLKDGDISLTLLIRFGHDDLIAEVHAESRARSVGITTESMPWQGRFWNYAVREGMRVPLEAEVEWLTPTGAKPYCRVQITTLNRICAMSHRINRHHQTGKSRNMETKSTAIAPDHLRLIDAYWRAANYLSVGQIYLYQNPLLRKPLTLAHIKPRLLGHWGTTR